MDFNSLTKKYYRNNQAMGLKVLPTTRTFTFLAFKCSSEEQ